MAEAKYERKDFPWVFQILGLLWAFGFGVFATVAPITLEKAGLSLWEIGIQSSAYYFSIGIGSLFVPYFLSGLGKKCVAIGMVLAGLSCIFFPWVNGWLPWIGIRLINGLGAAMSLVPLETNIIQNAPVSKKNRTFGLFELSLAVGFGAGGGIGPIVEPIRPGLSYLMGGLVILVGAFIALILQPTVSRAEQLQTPDRMLVLKCWVWFSTAFTQGFLEGGLLAYMALHLLHLGYGNQEVGLAFAVLFLGVVFSMTGVTRLADRYGGKNILAGTHGVSFILLIFLGFAYSINWILLLVLALGIAYGCQYAIALVALGKEFPLAQQPGANSLYLALNCLGSVLGPIVVGVALNEWGLHAIWFTGSIPVFLLIMAWAGWKILKPLHPAKC